MEPGDLGDSRVLSGPLGCLVAALCVFGCRPSSGAPSQPRSTAEPGATPTSSRSAPESDVAGPDAREGPPLTRDEIRTVVRAKLPEVRACFEAGLATNPALGGRVLLRFTINAGGRAEGIRVVENPSDDADLGACLVEALAHWQFPRPRGGAAITVSYPFVFSSERALRAAGLPRVEGTVKPAAVGAVFDARRGELDACLAGDEKGSIGVAFVVDEAGTLPRISTYTCTLAERTCACISRTIASWRFPPAAAGDEARVNHDLYW